MFLQFNHAVHSTFIERQATYFLVTINGQTLNTCIVCVEITQEFHYVSLATAAENLTFTLPDSIQKKVIRLLLLLAALLRYHIDVLTLFRIPYSPVKLQRFFQKHYPGEKTDSNRKFSCEFSEAISNSRIILETGVKKVRLVRQQV